MAEQLSQERAIRLLRAKAAELESWLLVSTEAGSTEQIDYLAADVALIATLVADLMERLEADG